MSILDRRNFLRMTTSAVGLTLLTGCGPAGKSNQQNVEKAAAMKHERDEQLHALYGIRFPRDFFDFWEWYNELPPEFVNTFEEELGIRLVGPFDVLAGKFDDVKLRYPAVLHWRYLYDPPEFFTVFSGNTDGLHWGYWFDDPARLPPVVSAFWASDAFELWSPGSTLFEAVASWSDGAKESLEENIEHDPDHADEYRDSLAALTKFERRLPTTSCSVSRKPTHQTPELMGVVIPPHAGKAGPETTQTLQDWQRSARQIESQQSRNGTRERERKPHRCAGQASPQRRFIKRLNSQRCAVHPSALDQPVSTAPARQAVENWYHQGFMG
ncbi:ADP-ribosylation family protein [Lignipirellula cremea]|uniref:SMI1 / KNR4 family protein n=1 Tax=Lignipirellula cremea TaxID=2528010 RepID=A0A518DYK8_9BACT|nr:ADP-ribosylation family protein [Lignipirellula cremea]QDU96932.1 hypothetical protein Pla8534_47550 [Lignipirellula cremea]